MLCFWGVSFCVFGCVFFLFLVRGVSIITRGTNYLTQGVTSCHGPDVAALPNNVLSGRIGTIAPTTCPHFEQPRRERPGTAACQDCPPSLKPRCPCLGLVGHRCRPSSGLVSQEGLCLIRPSSVHLASEHESGFSKLPRELWISLFLLFPCGCQSCPVLPHTTRMWEAITTRR